MIVKIINIGTVGLTPEEAKITRIVNIFSIMALVTLILLGILLSMSDNNSIGALVSLSSCLYILPLILNYEGRLSEGTFTFLTLSYPILLFLPISFGWESNIQLFYFPCIATPLILLRTKKVKWVFALFPLILWFVCKWYLNNNEPLIDIPMEYIGLFRVSTVLMTFTFAIVIFSSFVFENDKLNLDLTLKNEKLVSSEKKLKKQSQQLDDALKEKEAKNKELEKLTQDLKISNEKLEEFSYLVSHDLKAPIRRVKTLSTFIFEDEGIKESSREDLELISQTADGMTKLVHDLLNYSKIENLELSVIQRSLYEIVKSVCDLYEDKTVEIQIDDSLPEIKTDIARFKEVIKNIIDNGLKYNRSQLKKIKIRFSEKTGELEIKDNGIGLEKQYHEKIFLPFQRLHSKDKYNGTGIGLTLVKKILQRQGIGIRIESELNKGTSFFLDLRQIIIS